MTYKHYLGHVLSVEISKLECLGKRVLKFEVFFSGLKSVRLSELQANLKRACPGRFWTQFAWASCKQSSKRTRMLLLDRVHLSER